MRLAAELKRRFTARIAPILDAAQKGGTLLEIETESIATAYAIHIDRLAAVLVPNAKKRGVLLAWPGTAAMWRLTDHPSESELRHDVYRRRLGSQPLSHLSIELFRELANSERVSYGEQIDLLQHTSADVYRLVEALASKRDPHAVRIAEALRRGLLVEADQIDGDAPCDPVAGLSGVGSLATDEKELLVAINRWPVGASMRLFAALRLATVDGELIPVVKAPTMLIEAATSIRAEQLPTAPLRAGGRPPPLPRDMTGRTFPALGNVARWIFAPAPGQQLSLGLPEDGELSGLGAAARRVLSGPVLRTWLATWALAAEQAHPVVDGGFQVDPRYVTLELFNLRPKHTPSKGRLYERPPGGSEQRLADSLKILQEIQIIRLGDIELSSPQGLIHAYRYEPGTLTLYQHAPAAMAAVRIAYTQIPRAVMSLDADDAPIALAFANLWRARIVPDVMRGPGYLRGSLRELAVKLGAFRENEARKLGTSYWPKLAERLRRILVDGELGALDLRGAGPDGTVTLTPHAALIDAYGPLRDAQERARELDAQARLLGAAKRHEKRRPGRPRKG